MKADPWSVMDGLSLRDPDGWPFLMFSGYHRELVRLFRPRVTEAEYSALRSAVAGGQTARRLASVTVRDEIADAIDARPLSLDGLAALMQIPPRPR